MFSWDWQDFDEIITKSQLVVDSHGPLKGPILSFSIKRDSNLNLVMLTHSGVDTKDSDLSYPPGTVRQNRDRVTFVGKTGLNLFGEGVQPETTRTIIRNDPPFAELQQECTIQRLKGEFPSATREIKYVVDWLGNVPSAFHWPDMTDEVTEVKKTRKFGQPRTGTGEEQTTARGSTGRTSGAWNCARLVIDGRTLFLCSAQGNVAPGVKEPGYILYIGNPSDEFRDKVRNCLAFTLGKYLVYLGHSCFCENWLLIQFEAVAAYSMAGKAFELPTMPPFPLSLGWEWEINRDILSRAVNAFYGDYDSLNLASLAWAYWHAVSATPHIAGVHYGAVIESLERAYLETKGSTVKRSLIESPKWDPLRQQLETCIASAKLSGDTGTVFKNKISNLNAAPQSIVTEGVLSNLGLVLGPREKKALRLRNISAHGKDDDVDIEWIRDLKILRVRFHRMIIAMTGASDRYYDYFTVGRPTRLLAEQIPDE
jgi:hypothetical protein